MNRWLMPVLAMLLAVPAQAQLSEFPADDPTGGAIGSTPTPPKLATDGIWVSVKALRDSLPKSGSAWEHVVQWANKPWDSAPLLIAYQESNANVICLAKAYYYGATGNVAYRTEVEKMIKAVMYTEPYSCPTCAYGSGRTLGLGRELGAYVVAADVAGLTPETEQLWRAYLKAVIYQVMASNRTLYSTWKDRPNNWGTIAGGSLALVASYLGDATLMDTLEVYYQGWAGDRTKKQWPSGPGAGYQDGFGADSWMADSSARIPIGAQSATVTWPASGTGTFGPAGNDSTYSIDGAISEEMGNRGGYFRFPRTAPGGDENYAGPVMPGSYHWESIGGFAIQAEVLRRAGRSSYTYGNSALQRAVEYYWWLDSQFPTAGPDGDGWWVDEEDEQWVVPLARKYYNVTKWSTPLKASVAGKNMAFTHWTHGN